MLEASDKAGQEVLGTERVDLMPLLRFDGTVWGGYPLLVLGRDVVLPAAEESKGGAPTAGLIGRILK